MSGDILQTPDAPKPQGALDNYFKITARGSTVRQEVLEAAKDSPEFEELMDAYRREAMAIIARWDLADQLDGQRDAA